MFRHSCAVFQYPFQNHFGCNHSTVTLNFDNVFFGVGVRSRHIDCQHFIKNGVVFDNVTVTQCVRILFRLFV